MQNAINWFEIPVADLDRAQRFYETMLDRPLKREVFGGGEMAIFPVVPEAVGGCLTAQAPFVPAREGVMVYVDVAPSLNAALGRAEAAGGRVVLPPQTLPDGMGMFAHIVDSEGNKVGVHAYQ